MAGIERDRRQERLRYGETVFLLEPNVKRSRGALRDIQLIRWLGLVRYGTADFRQLHALGKLHEEDLTAILRATEFLLRLRNEMHFHAGQAADVLDRAEQLRIAELRGYPPAAGLLPVEQFMRDYFRHTDAVSHVAARFAANAQSSGRRERLVTVMFGHRVENGLHVGPAGLLATRTRSAKLAGRSDGHRAAGRSGESLRCADRRLDVGGDSPRGRAASRRAAVGRGVPPFPFAVGPSRSARAAAARHAQRRPAGTIHPRVRARPRAAAIQPVSQVHRRRALSAGGGVRHGACGGPRARRQGLPVDFAEASAAFGVVDPRSRQGASGGSSRGGAANCRRHGRPAGASAPRNRVAAVPRSQTHALESPGVSPRHGRRATGGSVCRAGGLARVAANALRADGGRLGGGRAGRLGRLEDRSGHRSLPPHHAVSRRRQPGDHR